MPGARSRPSMAAQNALSDGWLVRSAIAAVAKSTTSQPARVISSATATDADDVQCVWKCTGRSQTPRIAARSGAAAAGLRSPAMSLIPIKCAPAAAASAATPA